MEYYRYQEALRHPSITAVDSCNNRVQKFDSNGNFITKWGTLGTGDGQFSRPAGIGINSKGLVYVAETNNARVQIFAPSIPKQRYIGICEHSISVLNPSHKGRRF